MLVKDLLKRVTYEVVAGDLSCEAGDICCDTRTVKNGDAFTCIRGVNFDSHDKLHEIIEAKPALIVISEEWANTNAEGLSKVASEVAEKHPGVCIVKVPNTRIAKGLIAAEFYGNPAEKMTIIGVTGHKGKTTTTHILRGMIEAAGEKCGLVGTNGTFIGDEWFPVKNTTPDSEELQGFLKEMVDRGCKYAVIEVSSQAMKLDRTAGITFDIGVFMNIEPGDHVAPNEHATFEEYLYCKGLLLKNSKLALVCADDSHLDELLADVETPMMFFGHENEKYRPTYLLSGEHDAEKDGVPGLGFRVKTIADEGVADSGVKSAARPLDEEFYVCMPGLFNAMNGIAAVACANEVGLPIDAMREALERIHIKGRLDMVYVTDELTICVDIAHNGYSTQNLLEALRAYNPKRLVCVFGADGNRAYERRTGMGEAAGNYADFSIVTAGHNRLETFEEIFKGIKEGLDRTDGKYIVIPDRRTAIRKAIFESEPGDLIAICGFGNFRYIDENGVKTPYNDEEFALEVIEEWKGR